MSPNHTPPKNCNIRLLFFLERCEYAVSQLVDDTEEDDEKEEVQSSSLIKTSSHRETTRTSSHHYSVSGSGLRRRRGLTRDAASTSFPRARARRRRRPSVLRNGRGGRLRVAAGTDDDVVAGESRNRFSDFPSGVRLGATVLRKSARKNATRPRGFSATAERFELRDERGTVRV